MDFNVKFYDVSYIDKSVGLGIGLIILLLLASFTMVLVKKLRGSKNKDIN